MQVGCYLGVLLGSTAALNNLHADADHGETKGPTATFPESFWNKLPLIERPVCAESGAAR